MVNRNQKTSFDASCRKCARLARYLDEVRDGHPGYYCKPVPSFGDGRGRLLVVGLAPGKHGANATGRPFTGDHAGILLYETLYKFGYADRAVSLHAKDGLTLVGCRITNAVKCLPPENKPTNREIIECNSYLKAELARCRNGSVVLALGQLAHRAVLRAYGLVQARYPFGHNQAYPIGNSVTLLDSYHCSRYNTQTRRLTKVMFEDVFEQAARLLS